MGHMENGDHSSKSKQIYLDDAEPKHKEMVSISVRFYPITRCDYHWYLYSVHSKVHTQTNQYHEYRAKLISVLHPCSLSPSLSAGIDHIRGLLGVLPTQPRIWIKHPKKGALPQQNRNTYRVKKLHHWLLYFWYWTGGVKTQCACSWLKQ